MNALMNEISSAQREIHRLNESRIRKIIESSLDGVVSMNADGLVTYWGRQNISIFGWLEAEVLGQPLEEFIIPERFRKRHRDGLQNFLASGHASILNRRIEVFGLHRDGHELPIEISLSAIKEKQGWTFNAFIRDLSELRETETELRDAQIRLLRKERLATVGQLTATVAHELRTPMGTIRNSMFTLARKLGKNDSSTVQLIERVDRNVQRCDAIISQLLDFARDREIRVQPTAIAGWLDRLLDGYDLPQQVELVRNFPAAAYALMDPAYFESAVVNVLDNAVHAVSERYPQGGGRIEVGIESESGRVAVVVSDNGPGIAADDIELVMEPLFSTKVYGVGLGLPTVKKIMEKHGGEVVLGSNDGGGVRVCLWLMAARLKRAIKMSPDDNEDVLPRSVL
jgi:PAS domain S-box-containing protein